MKIVLFFFLTLSLCKSLCGQNNFELSLDYGYGNSVWKVSPIPFSTYGDLIITGSSPTISAGINLLYDCNKVKTGIGFVLQHFFIREIFTQGFPDLGIPTFLGQFANPTPNHFKFSGNIEYCVLNKGDFEINSGLKIGTFFDDDYSNNSMEGFHWFTNLNCNLNYKVTKSIEITLSPTFDYSRFNTPKDITSNGQVAWINIYSFYTAFGLTYNFDK